MEWMSRSGRSLDRLLLLSGISHGNPSRIPPWAGDGSAPSEWERKAGEWSAAGGSHAFSPQLLFKQHSLSPSSATASLCSLFECIVCLCTHLLSEWAARWQILAWVAHFDGKVFSLVFLSLSLLTIGIWHKQLSLEMSNSQGLLAALSCRMECFCVSRMCCMTAGISTLFQLEVISDWNKQFLDLCCDFFFCTGSSFSVLKCYWSNILTDNN